MIQVALWRYYLPEQKSAFVQEKIQFAREIYISSITDLEMLSAIKKKQRIGEIKQNAAEQAYQLFRKHRKDNLYNTLKLDARVFKVSEFILQATNTSLRTLDAIHLGIVFEYKTDLFSFDETLLKTADELKINTIDLV